jgi:hypothetical protein
VGEIIEANTDVATGYDSVGGFLRRHGQLGRPFLVMSDGNAGLTETLEREWPRGTSSLDPYGRLESKGMVSVEAEETVSRSGGFSQEADGTPTDVLPVSR